MFDGLEVIEKIVSQNLLGRKKRKGRTIFEIGALL